MTYRGGSLVVVILIFIIDHLELVDSGGYGLVDMVMVDVKYASLPPYQISHPVLTNNSPYKSPTLYKR